MRETFDIAGYCRISVDEELDRDNVSIENQKAILTDYVQQRFPGSSLTFYEDRDRSGYTFEQREGYQALRKKLMTHQYDILLVKDFSRFSRRNSRGLVELEDLRDAGVRIISVGDGIDFPNDDDWLKIQFQFLINEMPVTDTSKKVRNVIRRRQKDGEWLCAAPYGYIINKQKNFEVVPTEADVVRTIFKLYNNDGWGYKKIANYLTDQGIPTPRMSEQMRKEAEGDTSKRNANPVWAIPTIQGILDNDFYIGTLRQGKYTRVKINGRDVRRDEDDQIVIENHHQAIIDYRTFAITRSQREQRTKSNYRGVKINDNFYSGFLYCGDCGSPMFAVSRRNMKPAYNCGTYHKRGTAGCTSHHIRVDVLDDLLKRYLRTVLENSEDMIKQLNEGLKREDADVTETEQSADHLAEVMENLQEELKITKRQRIRDILRHPGQEAVLEETYDELESDLQKRIEGLTYQIEQLADRRNLILRVNRAAKTTLDIFREILEKDHLERNDLSLILDRILVYEDRLEVKLKPDVDALLRTGNPEEAANFNSDVKSIENTEIQSYIKQNDKIFDVHVLCDGDPLEIFTEKDGGVIFRKYSPVGELQAYAQQLCEAVHSCTGHAAAVADRDAVIAQAGAGRKELLDQSNAAELEELMQQRRLYRFETGMPLLPIVEGESGLRLGIAVPIVCQGDLMGCVALLLDKAETPLPESDLTLARTVAEFLSRQMET